MNEQEKKYYDTLKQEYKRLLKIKHIQQLDNKVYNYIDAVTNAK